MCPTQLLIKPCSTLKVHWRLSATLKTTNKYVWSNTFWYAEVNISWEFVQCTIHWDKTQILKKFLRAKGTFQIIHFFLSWAPTHYSFTFNLRFLYEMKQNVYLSKSMCGVFHCCFHLVFINDYIFVKHKAWTLWLKHHNFLQN